MSERKLTTRQRLFVEAYLANPNGVQAAKAAGYKGNDRTLSVVAAENLAKPNIAVLIEKRVEEAAMPANEVLQRLSEHARASLADLLDDDGQFNLAKARADKKDHLLKKLKVKKFITTSQKGNEYETITYEYEIHDPQAALVHLGRFHKLFTDRSEIDLGVRLLDEAE